MSSTAMATRSACVRKLRMHIRIRNRPLDHRAREQHALLLVHLRAQPPAERRPPPPRSCPRRAPRNASSDSTGSATTSTPSIRRQRVRGPARQIELLVERRAEHARAVHLQRQPHAQAARVARKLGAQLAEIDEAVLRLHRRQVRRGDRVRAPERARDRAPPDSRCRRAGRAPCADRASPSRRARCRGAPPARGR